MLLAPFDDKALAQRGFCRGAIDADLEHRPVKGKKSKRRARDALSSVDAVTTVLRRLNTRLPEDCVVRHVEAAPRDFDPRADATGKLYRSRPLTAATVPLNPTQTQLSRWPDKNNAHSVLLPCLMVATVEGAARAARSTSGQVPVHTRPGPRGPHLARYRSTSGQAPVHIGPGIGPHRARYRSTSRQVSVHIGTGHGPLGRSASVCRYTLFTGEYRPVLLRKYGW